MCCISKTFISSQSRFLLLLLILLPIIVHARHIPKIRQHHNHHHKAQYNKEESIVKPEFHRVGVIPFMHKRTDMLQVAGSKLPDCTHACGSCTPCRLVMVSFVCSSIEEAETCPMAYKCMCHNKSYPVP